MPARIIGMIGVAPPPGAALHVIQGAISPAFLASFARAHEDAGFDSVLVGYYSASAEGFNVALYAAMKTERLSFLIAHRPGFIAPTLAARKIATFDQLTQGRLQLHVIAGTSDKEQRSEGDFLPKQDRYRRAAEYLEVMRRVWSATAPFDHSGAFYRVEQAWSDVKPYQTPYPPLFFGGSSDEALEMGAAQCDVFAMYGEPLAQTRERIEDFRARAAAHGRTAGFNISFRPIIAPTEGEAWKRADAILTQLEESGVSPEAPGNYSAERLAAFAAQADVHDERLWMGVAGAAQGRGNTSCLVGTAEQVANAILTYYRLGASSFLLRGFDPIADVADYGRELIPRVRAGALAIDCERVTSAAEIAHAG